MRHTVHVSLCLIAFAWGPGLQIGVRIPGSPGEGADLEIIIIIIEVVSIIFKKDIVPCRDLRVLAARG